MDFRIVAGKTILWYCISLLLLHYGGDFGAHILFAVFSILYLIFTNLGKREPGTMSAYSVFNENCESIAGTLRGEDIDRQMGSAPCNNNIRQPEEHDDEDDDEMLQQAIRESLKEFEKANKRTGKKKKRRY